MFGRNPIFFPKSLCSKPGSAQLTVVKATNVRGGVFTAVVDEDRSPAQKFFLTSLGHFLKK
jgi:hypothetical protein